jgi:hypothetical protein
LELLQIYLPDVVADVVLAAKPLNVVQSASALQSLAHLSANAKDAAQNLDVVVDVALVAITIVNAL